MAIKLDANGGKFKDSVEASLVRELCNRFLELKTTCIRPETQQPDLILAITAGTNNSKEGMGEGLTHGFSVIFNSEEDRDYYVEQDPHHATFARDLQAASDRLVVFDYEPQSF